MSEGGPPFLRPAEGGLPPADWNTTAAEFPRGACAQQLFEAQVARTPDAIAVQFEGEQLSYRALDARAEALARRLTALGVGPETRVALILERSLEMVVGLWGILKAGGAYVPLDPDLPVVRLAYMLEDSKAAVAVTRAAIWSALPPTAPRACLVDAPGAPSDAAAERRPAAAPANLAYVIYTSGSTGRPKGVALTHQNLVSFFAAMDARLGEAPGVWLAVTTISFDIAALELLWTLTRGFRVVIHPGLGAAAQRGGGLLSEALIASGATHLQATPSLYRVLLLEPEAKAALGKLEALLVGGEALAPDLASALVAAGPARIFNMYGPTETTIWSSVAAVRAGERVSIGRPIANTRMYVLDERLQPQPVGVPGELYIGGAGVARGYWARPELTAERFVPDPFSLEAGERLYRTGDLARFRPDGTLECLGRIDNQVKVRGHRVEPGEIEHEILSCAGIREAAVVGKPDGRSGQRLAAYFCGEGEAASPHALRRHLANRLPTFMLPAALVRLERLPLNPNGKVDRDALPEPDWGADGRSAYLAPRTDVERKLAVLWQQVLGLAQVGAHDDFFDLGGDSLSAASLLSRIAQTFGVQLGQQSLFEARTLERISARLAARPAAGVAVPTIPKAPAGTVAPASLGQQGLWLAEVAAPGSAAYNEVDALRLRGPLDAAALARSVDALLSRHAALRATFSPLDGVPMIAIAPEPHGALEPRDLSGLGAGAEAQALRLVAEQGAAPFDLVRGPLYRFGLFKLREDEHLLSLTFHHLVWDAWTHDLLLHDLGELYRAQAPGERSAPASTQFLDYALWQRARFERGEMAPALEFWSRTLADRPEGLGLATAPLAPRRANRPAERADFSLPASTAQEIKGLATAERATPFMLLLAAWGLLLERYTGQRDFVVGSPAANRPVPDLERVAGYFVNMLPLRVRLPAHASFRQLVAQARAVSLEAFEHREVPFDQIVRVVPNGAPGLRQPLLQTVLAYGNEAALPGFGPGLRAERVSLIPPAAKFDLVVEVDQAGDALVGRLLYDADLFEARLMQQMAGHFGNLLSAALAEPDRPADQLELMTEGERRRVVDEWNDTATDFPGGASIHRLFEEQVARTPEAIAIEAGEERLSYRQLDLLATGLAHRLHAMGVGPETPVGVLLERGVAFVSTALGILKAGGAYVPLDPSYPDERLAVMLEDCATPVIVTDARHGQRRVGGNAARLVLDEGWRSASAPPARASAPSSPHGLAYVMYTSGSTGRPKGVCVTHQAVVRLVKKTNYVEISPGDRIAHASNTAFDAATFEIWGALLNGATVIGLTTDEMLTPVAMYQAIRAKRVQSLFLTTALFNELVRYRSDTFSTLRDLLFGGEACDPALVRRVAEEGRPRRYLHVYGPTEATTFASWHLIDRVPERARTVPIGAPLANDRLYVLDAGLRPVPVGVAGELFIGGAGLARGYWHQPGATADRFLPDPFSAAPGARMYRTGDVVRRLADGDIEHLGRADFQVKIRGFRIELGEVEAALLRVPAVGQALAMAREDAPGSKRLVAYVAPKGGARVEVDALRSALKQALPEYMTPSAFVVLDALPLNPNGKIDRKALPAPPAAGQASNRKAPRTPTEEAVAALWAEVLNLQGTSTDDDFFSLGGHSLLAVRLLSRLEAVLGVAVPMRDFLAAPTVEGLAEAIVEVELARLGSADAEQLLSELEKTE